MSTFESFILNLPKYKEICDSSEPPHNIMFLSQTDFLSVNGEIKIIHEGNKWPHSLGLLYSAITYYLGWRPHYDEGSIMGLASFGNDNHIFYNSNSTH